MKIAIAQAYNGMHKIYKKELGRLKVSSFYFNIDKFDWYKITSKVADAYLWHADDKQEAYRKIYDRIYFIQEIIDKPVFPDMNMYFAQGDKVKQYQILSYLKVPRPKTYIAISKAQAQKIIRKIKYPFVLKDPYGYGGHHVFKIDNNHQALKYIQQIFNSGLKTHHSLCKNIFYAQEFLALEKDLRVITIGHKVFCAYWRQNKKGGWKHNLDQGAQISFDKPPAEALKLCQQISQKMKFHWMSYDVFVTPDNKIMINEYSCNFASKGSELLGFNVRQAQMKYLKNYLAKIK